MSNYIAELKDVAYDKVTDTMTFVFDGKAYTLVYNDDPDDLSNHGWVNADPYFRVDVVSGNLYIETEDSNEHTIGAYVMKKETSGDLVEFASFTFTGEADQGVYFGRGDRTIPFIENAIVTFDGTEYEMERGVNEDENVFYYGEFDDGGNPSFNTYPFATIGGSALPTFLVSAPNEHTIAFSGNVSFTKVFDGNVTVSGGAAEVSNSSLLEDKKSYKVVFDGTEYYGTAIYYDDPEEPATELVLNADPEGDNPLIGVENGVTTLLYAVNGTYDLSLYEIVE